MFLSGASGALSVLIQNSQSELTSQNLRTALRLSFPGDVDIQDSGEAQ